MSEKLFFFLCQLFLSLALAPLLPGIINKVKAIFAGRHGRPVLQTYFEIWKLLQKSETISKSATWITILAPSVLLASSILALALLPLSGAPSPIAFTGDFILATYILGMGRFATTLGALDSASPFEGMGASREASFSALAEPALFLAFLILSSFCLQKDNNPHFALTLSSMLNGQAANAWTLGRPELIIAPIAFFLLLLSENCRIPVDDPDTHLELTMIHEAMILDQSGPNLAMIIYSASLKLWFFASVCAALIIPPIGGWTECALWVCSILAIAILTGIVESTMARLRLLAVPQLLGATAALAALSLILTQAR